MHREWNPCSNFRSSLEPDRFRSEKFYDEYGDEIDSYRKPYVRGSEADIGEYKPTNLGPALAAFLDRARNSVVASEKADSPIETILGAAILTCFKRNGKEISLCAQSALDKAERLVLVPQYRWGIYRSDWALYNPRTGGAMLIECDGKDFHSSDEQVAHDAAKDAEARQRGFKTARFTGSQIHRYADGCAQHIFDFVYGEKNGPHQKHKA